MGLADDYPNREKDIVVKITTDGVNELLGTNYDTDTIIATLSNVGFVVKKDKDVLVVEVPKWRMDIHIKEDVIEEVGRLLGYDNISLTLPLHATASINNMLELKKQIRHLMERYGANEVLTYSFVSSQLIQKVQQDVANSYRIVNSISPDLQYVRQSIVPSLLDKAFLNQKLPIEQFAIYEMNIVYRKEDGVDTDGVPNGTVSLGFVLAERKNDETAYYKAKKYVETLLKDYNIVASYLPLDIKTAESLPFEATRSAKIMVGEKYIGVVGEFKNSVRNSFKLGKYLAGFEINLDVNDCF